MSTTRRWSGEQPGGGPSLSSTKISQPIAATSDLNVLPHGVDSGPDYAVPAWTKQRRLVLLLSSNWAYRQVLLNFDLGVDGHPTDELAEGAALLVPRRGANGGAAELWKLLIASPLHDLFYVGETKLHMTLCVPKWNRM